MGPVMQISRNFNHNTDVHCFLLEKRFAAIIKPSHKNAVDITVFLREVQHSERLCPFMCRGVVLVVVVRNIKYAERGKSVFGPRESPFDGTSPIMYVPRCQAFL